jgi:hypothetical protein
MTIETYSQLAEAIGITPSGVSKLRRRPDWPIPAAIPKGGYTRADVDAVQQWRARCLQENRAIVPLSPDQADARHQREWEATLLTRIKRELLEGKYVELTLHRRAVKGLADVFVRAIAEAANAIPDALHGLTQAQRSNVTLVLGERIEQAMRNINARARVELTRNHRPDTNATPRKRQRVRVNRRAAASRR